MSVIVAVFFLIIGLAALIKSADFLVEGAASLAKRFGIREIVIGLIIVSFGTSAPELVVNVLSALSGNYDLAIGNVVGSNIANTFLILGVSAAIFPLIVKRGTVWKEIPLSLLAAVALLVLISDTLLEGESASILSRADGIMLLFFFIIFLYYSYGISRTTGEAEENDNTKVRSVSSSVTRVIGGIAGLVVGGHLIVSSAVTLAQVFGVSEGLIGLTVVALGTSLPELATSAVAAYRKKADIAVGNVVGSNIFNIFFILGITSLISPLPVGDTIDIDVGMTILSSLLLFLVLFVGKKHTLQRGQGVFFIVLYLAYIIFRVWQG
ncbi:MAG: calcium/sodium antiporter [Candidatus Andersenbacteria bacterium]